MVPARPGRSLEKLIKILRPKRLLAATGQDRRFTLDLEARERRLRHGLGIPSKAFRIPRYAVVYKTGFGRHAGDQMPIRLRAMLWLRPVMGWSNWLE